MKATKVTLILLLFANLSWGQTRVVSLGALYSTPIGDFGSKQLDKGGFADPGWGLYFDSETPLGLGLSLISHSTYSWVPLDNASLEQEFTDYLGLRTEIDGGKHKPFFTTIGLGYGFKLGPLFSIGLTGQIGVLYNSFSAFDIRVYDSDEHIVFRDVMRYDSDFAFAYLFGVRFNVIVVPGILALQVSGDYAAGTVDTYLRSQHFGPIKGMETMEFFNLGMGLAFYLNGNKNGE